MPATLLLIGRVLLSPLWLLWRLYLVLWWAFGEESKDAGAPRPLGSTVVPSVRGVFLNGDPAPAAERRATQDAAFEIVDSTPAPTPKPIGVLKLGFAFSLLACGLLAWMTRAAGGHELIRSSSEWPVWLWSSCVVFVGSLWPVRHIARRQRASAPGNWREHAACVAGGMKDAGVAAYAGAKQAKGAALLAGRRVYSAVTSAGDGARRLWNRAHSRTA
jgi:hypothetical protein